MHTLTVPNPTRALSQPARRGEGQKREVSQKGTARFSPSVYQDKSAYGYVIYPDPNPNPNHHPNPNPN